MKSIDNKTDNYKVLEIIEKLKKEDPDYFKDEFFRNRIDYIVNLDNSFDKYVLLQYVLNEKMFDDWIGECLQQKKN